MAAGKFYRSTKKVQKVQIVKKKTKARKYAIMKTPFRNKIVTKLRYAQSLQLIGGGPGAPSSRAFRAGDLYDPDFTGTGHQPRGFDQLMTLYDHFVVLHSKITVYFTLPSLATINNLVSISLRDNGTTISSHNDILEYGNRVITTLTVEKDYAVLSYTYSPQKFLGRKSPMSDPDLKGSDSASPVENAFFHVTTMANDVGQTTSPTGISVVIDYVVALIEPNQPAQS